VNDLESKETLVTWMTKSILRDGPLSFEKFMGLALYHPQFGYYTAPESHPGRKGDFFTSVSVGACFGQLLADYVQQVWERQDQPVSFAVLEQGANTGQLATDILNTLRDDYPSCYEAVHYFADDKSARAMTHAGLASHSGKWSLQPPPSPITGCFLCNELVDAFPVHRIEWTGDSWVELMVGLDTEESFVWKTSPITDSNLLAETKRIETDHFSVGYQTEIHLAAIDWASHLSSLVARGSALIIDYGFDHGTYYQPSRKEGTLQAYAKHRKVASVLDHPGKQDLTAHVNFTRLEEATHAEGFITRAFQDQSHFLTNLAKHRLLKLESSGQATTSEGAKWIRQFQQLTHPGLMGQAFKVLELEKK